MKVGGARTARRILGRGLAACALALLPSAAAQATTWDVFTIRNVGEMPGLDYDQIVTSDPVDLGDKTLLVIADEVDGCGYLPDRLETGQVYTLVSTTGGLTGAYQQVPDDTTVGMMTLGHDCGLGVRSKLRIAYHESGPVQTVTATVVDGSPIPVTTTHLAVPSEPLQTNQPVTLTATVRPSSGSATGTVSFFDRLGPGDGELCVHVPVHLVRDAYTATCDTSLRANVGEDLGTWSGNLRADFTPSDAGALKGSSNSNWGSVGLGATSTALAVDPATTGPFATATVTPTYAGPLVPTGTVAFRDGGTPVPGCDARPLVGSTPQASCDLGSLSPGDHAITASYAGDAAFATSSSVTQAIAISSQPLTTPLPPATRPAP